MDRMVSGAGDLNKKLACIKLRSTIEMVKT